MYHDGNSNAMVEYGFIEDGYLRIKSLDTIFIKNANTQTGELETKVITVEDQIKDLPPEWKPLERIDDEKIRQAKDGYIVNAIPYDAGERISYHYEVVPDRQAMRRKIEELKASLTDTDYQVIKCYEASLIGAPMPYDMTELHNSRQEIRDQINNIDQKICDLE